MFVLRRFVEVTVSAGLLLGFVAATEGQQRAASPSDTFRDGFESAQPSWEREYTDATIRLQSHDRSPRAVHEGRFSEHYEFEATGGNQFYVSYTTPRIPVTDELSLSVFVRANRGGARLFARVVLPADIDPDTRAPSFVMVPGTIFDQPDRWQKLEIVHIQPTVERLARVLRASTRRQVQLDGAYVERLVVNLMSNPGHSDVFLDDLEISPVPEELLTALAKSNGTEKTRVAGAGSVAAKGSSRSKGRIRLERNLLEKRGDDGRFTPWFPTAVDAPGANVVELRRMGHDIIFDSDHSELKRLKTVVDEGVLLIKRVSSTTSTEGARPLTEQMNAYPFRDAVAFWDIGDHLGRKREIAARTAELSRFREALGSVRELDEADSRLVIGTVEGDFPLYARAPMGLDVIAIEPRLWACAQSFLESYQYLAQRKLLTARSNLAGLFWAWIPAATPPAVIRNIWGDNTVPAWGAPSVQPEQLRLMTYLALSAGYRGLGFRGDAELTAADGPGRLLAIEMTFLNFEIDICEQILAENDQAIPFYSVFDPDPLPVPSNANQLQSKKPPKKPELLPRGDMRASAIKLRDRKGALLLVADYAAGGQYQPGQMAADKLVVTPILPEGAQAFEITSGEVKVLTPERVPGGRRVTLEEFDTTSLILCTGDLGLYERVRSNVEALRHLAVPLAIEQAEIMLKLVTEINGRLAADGHQIRSKVDLKLRRQAGMEGAPPDVPDLLARSTEAIKNAREAQDRQDYALAWAEARRARRPLRLIMSGHWDQAWAAFARAAESINPEGAKAEDEEPKRVNNNAKVKLNAPLQLLPISCPPCISFYTLPESYLWIDWIKGRPGYRFGPNRVPSGDFDDPESITAEGWIDVSYQSEGIVGKIGIVPRIQANGKALKKNRPSLDQLSPDNYDSNLVVKLNVSAENNKDLDTILPKFFDFPVAAIRSPPITMEANNLIRISVLVKRPYQSAGGLGGIIVRDSIGGEQFQFVSSAPIPSFSRVVLFRKAPEDGTFTVTLGLAGYAEAYFDDFRVEVIERDTGPIDRNLVNGRRRNDTSTLPQLPDPALPASASRPTNTRPR
jgi:hypothetical protein